MAFPDAHSKRSPQRIHRLGEPTGPRRTAIPVTLGADLGQAIPDAADGLDQPGVILAELRADPAHVDVDGPHPAEVVVAPDERE